MGKRKKGWRKEEGREDGGEGWRERGEGSGGYTCT